LAIDEVYVLIDTQNRYAAKPLTLFVPTASDEPFSPETNNICYDRSACNNCDYARDATSRKKRGNVLCRQNL